MINLPTARAAVASAARWLAAFALLMLAVDHAPAQTTTTSAVDGTTPLGISRGAPAGSYGLSGFDSVNLYNGNLNFRLPLLQIGGRGGGHSDDAGAEHQGLARQAYSQDNSGRDDRIF